MGILSVVWPANDTRHLALDPMLFDMSSGIKVLFPSKECYPWQPTAKTDLQSAQRKTPFSQVLKCWKKICGWNIYPFAANFRGCSIQLGVATCIPDSTASLVSPHGQLCAIYEWCTFPTLKETKCPGASLMMPALKLEGKHCNWFLSMSFNLPWQCLEQCLATQGLSTLTNRLSPMSWILSYIW